MIWIIWRVLARFQPEAGLEVFLCQEGLKLPSWHIFDAYEVSCRARTEDLALQPCALSTFGQIRPKRFVPRPRTGSA